MTAHVREQQFKSVCEWGLYKLKSFPRICETMQTYELLRVRSRNLQHGQMAAWQFELIAFPSFQTLTCEEKA